jgi:hypothetical protein
MPKCSGVSSTAYFKAKKTLADALAAIGHSLHTNEVVAYILSGLGSEYDYLIRLKHIYNF